VSINTSDSRSGFRSVELINYKIHTLVDVG